MRTRTVTKRTVLTIGVGVLLGATSLSAQQHEHGTPDQDPDAAMGMSGMMQMMGQGMMAPGMMRMMGQGMGMMATGGPSAATMLRMGEALRLTDEQKSRLQAIQEQYSESTRMPMQQVMQAHQQAAAALQGESPDFEAYEDALREGAARMVDAHVAMARAAVEAKAVLTDEQRSQLRNLAQMMRGMMMGGGQSGMMGPGGGDHF